MKKLVYSVIAILILTVLAGCENRGTNAIPIADTNVDSETNLNSTPDEIQSINNNQDVFDLIKKDMSMDEVINCLGNDYEFIPDDMIYNNIEFCGLSGTLSIRLNDSVVTFPMWEYDAGGRNADECKSEIQMLCEYFESKFGEAEIREFSTRSAGYIWYKEENDGSTSQYVLDFDDTESKIRLYINYSS